MVYSHRMSCPQHATPLSGAVRLLRSESAKHIFGGWQLRACHHVRREGAVGGA